MQTLIQPAKAVSSSPHDRLANLYQAVLDYYAGRELPMPLAQMLPCVDDALASKDDQYIQLQDKYFAIVVQGCVLGRPVWLKRDEGCP